MRSRIPYAIVLALAMVWFAFHWKRLTAADLFADSAAMHRVPDQSLPPVNEALDKIPTFFLMSDAAAGTVIVKDIAPTLGMARWTGISPVLKFSVNNPEGQRFAMDFFIPDTTFTSTGPPTLTVLVNGHKLGSLICKRSGRFHFEQPVPEEWLKESETATVEPTVDKLWTSPSGDARLGYLLIGAGFLH